jgi:hypothetical protein
MIFQAAEIWNMSADKISTSISELKKGLSAIGQEKAEKSYTVLEDIIVQLKTSENYPEEEDPIFFESLMVKLESVFKHLLEAYMLERSIDIPDDSISRLNQQFYDDIAIRRGLPQGKYVPQAYPPITLLIRMLRNCQHHAAVGPVDHITEKRTYGNVYTLCSALILSIYAYIEILDAWLTTERRS